MSINGLDFDPVSWINTGVDVFARAGSVSAMPGMAGMMTLKVEGSACPFSSVQFSSTVLGGGLPMENHRYGDERTSVAGSGARCSER